MRRQSSEHILTLRFKNGTHINAGGETSEEVSSTRVLFLVKKEVYMPEGERKHRKRELSCQAHGFLSFVNRAAETLANVRARNCFSLILRRSYLSPSEKTNILSKIYIIKEGTRTH